MRSSSGFMSGCGWLQFCLLTENPYVGSEVCPQTSETHHASGAEFPSSFLGCAFRRTALKNQQRNEAVD